MFKRFAALAALVVSCGLAMGQTKPKAWTVEKSYQGGIAQLTVPSNSVAAVWDITMKTLFKMKKMEVKGDKPSGTITARRPGAIITFLISQNDLAVDINTKWEFMGGEKIQMRPPFSQATRFFDEFFPLLLEALK